MADPQDYTDAQLSDGTVLRFMGNLGPDEVRQKVTRYKATKAISANPPGVQPPRNPILPTRYSDIVGPGGGPGSPGEYEASSPLTPRQALKESGRAIGMGVSTAVPALATGGGSLLAEMGLYGAGGAANTALEGGTPKETAISGAVGAAMPMAGRAVGPVVRGVGRIAGGIAEKMDPDIVGTISPRLSHVRNLLSKTARLAAKYGPQAAEEAAPTLTEQMSAPTPPGSATWQRPLPMPESGPPAAPTASSARPSLSEQMESAQPERRVSQQPYTGPNRRIAPEERGFLTAPPLDPERIGVDYRPAEDLGVKVRQETEAAKGPIKRGGAKALKQAEALGRPATSNKLIQDMGGQPVESITGQPLSAYEQAARDSEIANAKLRKSLDELGPAEGVGQKPFGPSSNRVWRNGSLYEHRYGTFYKDGKILDDAKGIVEATDALEAPRGTKVIEGTGRIQPEEGPPTSNKLLQGMEERPPYVPLGFREGPPPGTTVPQSAEESQAALDMSLRRARRKLQ